MFPLVLGADALGAGELTAPEETVTPPAATVPRGSWESLLAVYRTAAAEAEQNARQPWVSCPNDGEPLLVGPDGRPFCPSDGWRPR